MSVVIVDYEMGNVGSIRNLLRKAGIAAQVSRDPDEIERATKLILPGVGSFDHGMRRLREYGLIAILNRKVRLEGTPLLGICLGMQLLADCSEEGSEEGLGWIEAEVVRFRFVDSVKRTLKIPHMGWNTVAPTPKGEAVGLTSDSRFYFVHSYHMVCVNEDDVIGRTTYGNPFVSAVRRSNIIGVQFHPEKSHRFGMAFLTQFVSSTQSEVVARC